VEGGGAPGGASPYDAGVASLRGAEGGASPYDAFYNIMNIYTSFMDQEVSLLNQYEFTDKETQRLILEILDLRIKFNFLGLLSACDELRLIDIPERETLETLFAITINILENKLPADKTDLIKDVKYKDAIKKILGACQKFYDQITNKYLTNDVLDVSIDNLFAGKNLPSGNTDYTGLTKSNITFPLILAKNADDQKQILTKFKEVANLYIVNGLNSRKFMTPDQAEQSLFGGVSGVGSVIHHQSGSSKKRTTSVKRKTAKRNRSNRNRRPHHHHHRHRRRTSRK